MGTSGESSHARLNRHRLRLVHASDAAYTSDPLTDPTTMEHARSGIALRRAAVAVAFAALGALGGLLTGPTLRATEASVTVEVPPGSDAETAAALGSLPVVLDPAAAKLTVSAADLADRVTVRAVSGTRLVQVRARASSAELAVAAADAVAQSLNATAVSSTEGNPRVLGSARVGATMPTPWTAPTRGALSGLAVAALLGALLTPRWQETLPAESAELGRE